MSGLQALRPVRRAQSLRDRVHDKLRAAILSGELAPGTPVIEAEIAVRLGASRTPVREALRRLEAAGLLEPRGGRGSVVRALERSEVACIFEIRQALESLASRRAARRMTPAGVRRLEAALEGMRAARDDAAELARHDTEFHDVILGLAHGERLRRMLGELREELVTYRFLSLGSAARRRASIEEHVDILDALRRGDEDAAALATATHIANAGEAVMAAVPG